MILLTKKSFCLDNSTAVSEIIPSAQRISFHNKYLRFSSSKSLRQIGISTRDYLFLNDKDIELWHNIDSIVPRAKRETESSVGEYFLFCVLNRMVQVVRKNKLADWYRKNAIEHIRPIDLEELTRNDTGRNGTV